jgi:hypothetical protein
MGDIHNLTIENQKRVLASAVAEVNGFSEREIKLTLVGGKRLTVMGQDMKISHFQKESGQFIADGEIFGIKYQGAGQNFFRRIVK